MGTPRPQLFNYLSATDLKCSDSLASNFVSVKVRWAFSLVESSIKMSAIRVAVNSENTFHLKKRGDP